MNLIVVENKSQITALSSLNVGDFAVIEPNSYRYSDRKGHVVLKMNDYAIDLTDAFEFPEYELYDIHVRKLETGTKITLTVAGAVGIKLTVTQEAEIRRLRVENKINAIKRVREITNAGLLESKNYVDSL